MSSQEQAEEGLSLDAQEERLRYYVKANDMRLVGIERDAGKSGGRLDRPGFERAMRFIQSRRATALVVVKLDRLTRTLRDLLTVLDTLEEHGAGLISLAETFDTQTPAGRAMTQMIGVFAEWERAEARVRTEAVRAHKRRHGEHVGGQPPVGYKLAKNADGVSILVPDETEREAMKKAKDMRTYMRYSLQSIADAFNAEAVPRRNGGAWTRQAVSRLLE